MKISKKIAVTFNVYLEIDVDRIKAEEVGGTAEDFTQEELIEEATNYCIQEMDYQFRVPDGAYSIDDKKTHLSHYENI